MSQLPLLIITSHHRWTLLHMRSSYPEGYQQKSIDSLAAWQSWLAQLNNRSLFAEDNNSHWLLHVDQEKRLQTFLENPVQRCTLWINQLNNATKKKYQSRFRILDRQYPKSSDMHGVWQLFERSYSCSLPKNIIQPSNYQNPDELIEACEILRLLSLSANKLPSYWQGPSKQNAFLLTQYIYQQKPQEALTLLADLPEEAWPAGYWLLCKHFQLMLPRKNLDSQVLFALSPWPKQHESLIRWHAEHHRQLGDYLHRLFRIEQALKSQTPAEGKRLLERLILDLCGKKSKTA